MNRGKGEGGRNGRREDKRKGRTVDEAKHRFKHDNLNGVRTDVIQS